MKARYTFLSPQRGGRKRSDSGFDDFSAKRLLRQAELLLRSSGYIWIDERGWVVHVYFRQGLASILVSLPGIKDWSVEGPIAREKLPELFELFEDGSDPTAFVQSLPRVRRVATT
jgi:hypothetical protein